MCLYIRIPPINNPSIMAWIEQITLSENSSIDNFSFWPLCQVLDRPQNFKKQPII